MINYYLAKENRDWECENPLYRYVFGSNGVLIYAKRPEFEAAIMVQEYEHPIPGLKKVTPFFRIAKKVPARLVQDIFFHAKVNLDVETLYYLDFTDGEWTLDIPKQKRTIASVRPTANHAGIKTCLEVHSHNRMMAYFSKADDNEESGGFRIYSVIGYLDQPCNKIVTRVGIYGHFGLIDSRSVFEFSDFCDTLLLKEERFHGNESNLQH